MVLPTFRYELRYSVVVVELVFHSLVLVVVERIHPHYCLEMLMNLG
jgi:hypothetical protein